MPKLAKYCGCDTPATKVAVLADESQKLCEKTYMEQIRVKRNVLKYRTAKKKITRTEMKPAKRWRDKVEQRERTVMVRMERLVTKYKDVVKTKEVPQTRYVKKAVLGDPKKVAQLHVQYKGCGCYQAQCGCVGQAGCGCCQPACSCAPPIDQLARPIEYIEEP